MARLYIVATPLGNLGDISARALDVLGSVAMVASEDTRQTLKLLTHFGIRTKLLSCRAQNEEIAAAKIVAALDEGKDIAYTSDAGTPALSDPGALLVRKVSEAGHEVLPVPGPSGFAALISVCGAFDKSVLFEGFLSPKSGRRRTRLQELLSAGSAFVLYESPYRIVKLFSDLAEFESERYVCVGREMTKLHEEYLRGSVADVYTLLAEKKEQRGEFSVYVSGKCKKLL
ncbi:MAG: 16S rRNA (cytidine(1402)-2'-O)-methyltransferase [Spirochaetaceae bacterium]|jgi:16S rRNA (cytidine1402-2'-O)-methyltransferase|nr:16S rRNA (cytidine(1402)-2'-O)-methyltransferase [Spirochaetaceae bacterium]